MALLVSTAGILNLKGFLILLLNAVDESWVLLQYPVLNYSIAGKQIAPFGITLSDPSPFHFSLVAMYLNYIFVPWYIPLQWDGNEDISSSTSNTLLSKQPLWKKMFHVPLGYYYVFVELQRSTRGELALVLSQRLPTSFLIISLSPSLLCGTPCIKQSQS